MKGLRSRIIYLILKDLEENNLTKIQEINKAMIIKLEQKKSKIIRKTLINFIKIFNINIKTEKFQKINKYENFYNSLIIKINKIYSKKNINELNEIFNLLKQLSIATINHGIKDESNEIMKKILK